MLKAAIDGLGRSSGGAGAVKVGATTSAPRFLNVRPRMVISVRAAGTPDLTVLLSGLCRGRGRVHSRR